jgi:Spy/CpxP family protein refolding chaperone
MSSIRFNDWRSAVSAAGREVLAARWRSTVDALGAARAEYRRLYAASTVDVRAVRKVAQRVQELEELRSVLARELLTVV